MLFDLPDVFPGDHSACLVCLCDRFLVIVSQCSFQQGILDLNVYRCFSLFYCLPKLRNQHIRYLALGHIHSYEKDQLDLDGHWCYCGCLEGRGFDELGQKGFVLLDVDKAKVKSEFVPFATRTMEEIFVDITGLTTVTQILSAMEQAGSAVPASSLVKFTLTGTHTLETQRDFRFLEKMLESRYYYVKIKDESRLEIACEDYEHDISLKGEFIRMVLASDKTEEEKERIIRFGIQALLGQEVEA